MQARNDKQLLREWNTDQSHDAFQALVERYAPLVWGVASRRLTNHAARQDAVAQVFVDLAKRAKSLARDDRSLGPWLHRCAVLVCLQEIRRESRRSKLMKQYASESPPSGQAPDATLPDILPDLDAAILNLNEKERQALLGRFYHQRTYAQIARDTGESEAAIQRRGHRALKKLERKLQPKLSAGALAGGLSLILAPPTPAGVLRIAHTAAVATPSTGLWTAFKSLPAPATTLTAAATLGMAFALGFAIPLAIPLASARLAKPKLQAADPNTELPNKQPARISAIVENPGRHTRSGLDLAALRRELEKLPDPDGRSARILALRRIMYSLSDDDIAEVHELLGSLSSNAIAHANDVIRSFFGRWAETDGEQAAKSLLALIESVMNPNRPSRPKLAAHSTGSNAVLQPSLSIYAIAGDALSAWARVDRDTVWAWLEDNAKGELDWRICGAAVLKSLREHGVAHRELLDLADATPASKNRQSLQGAVIRAWLNGANEADALDHIYERYSPEFAAQMIGKVALKNAREQVALEQTASWLGRILISDSRFYVAHELFPKWLRRDLSAAWRAMVREQDALDSITNRWTLMTGSNPYWTAGREFQRRDLAEATAALSQLSNPIAIEAFRQGMMDGLPESEQIELEAQLVAP